jgi:hypothetical protein
MTKNVGSKEYTAGYPDAILTRVKQTLLDNGCSAETIKILDYEHTKSTPPLKPTRISIREVDKYIARLCTTLFTNYMVPTKTSNLVGIITSCRSVGESTVGTLSTIFEHPEQVAVPSELIILVTLDAVLPRPRTERVRPDNGAEVRPDSGAEVKRAGRKYRTRKSKTRKIKRMRSKRCLN